MSVYHEFFNETWQQSTKIRNSPLEIQFFVLERAKFTIMPERADLTITSKSDHNWKILNFFSRKTKN